MFVKKSIVYGRIIYYIYTIHFVFVLDFWRDFILSKKEMISLWVLAEQKKTCKDLGIKYPEIWNAGYEIKVPKKKEELKNLAKKHYDLYIHFNELYIRCEKENKVINSKIEELCKEYKQQGRSIYKPTRQDQFWINSRCKKHNISVKDFFENLRVLESIKVQTKKEVK